MGLALRRADCGAAGLRLPSPGSSRGSAGAMGAAARTGGKAAGPVDWRATEHQPRIRHVTSTQNGLSLRLRQGGFDLGVYFHAGLRTKGHRLHRRFALAVAAAGVSIEWIRLDAFFIVECRVRTVDAPVTCTG